MNLEQQIKKKAKSGFEVWQHTVDMTRGELPEPHNAGELNEKIKEIRKRKIWVRLSDVLKAIGNLEKSHIIKSKQQLEKEIEKAKKEQYGPTDPNIQWFDGYIFAKEELLK